MDVSKEKCEIEKRKKITRMPISTRLIRFFSFLLILKLYLSIDSRDCRVLRCK